MSLFRRKQKENTPPQIPPPKECNHKWKDFDWYIDFKIYQHTLNYTIYEPYVCIHCKERKDVALERENVKGFNSNKEALEYVGSIINKYPKIKDRAIIEDEIHDTQLIDREYLKYAAIVMGVKI